MALPALDHIIWEHCWDEANPRLQQARVVSRYESACNVLYIRDMVRNIISARREEKKFVEDKAKQKASAVENLRRDMDELESDVQDLST